MIRRGALLARGALSDKFVRTSAWLFVGFLTSGLFNYGFQVAMGRLLRPADYGFLNALLGVSAVLGVPVSTLLMVLAKKTAECRAMGALAEVKGLFHRANGLILKAGVPALALFALAAGPLGEYLRAPSRVPVLILGLCVISAVSVPVNTALLQGLQDYKWFGINSGLAGPARFFFGVLMAWAGLGVNGVLIGLLLTNAAMWALAFMPVRRHLRSIAVPAIFGGAISWRPVVPILVANLAFAVMTQMDLVLVNHYFSPSEAALYASAAVLGRAVMYIPGTLVLAMFPMVSEQQALSVDSRPLLLKTVLMTVGLSGIGAALFFLAPHWIITVLFGSRYAGAAGVLKYFGVAMLSMALLLVMFNYLVARGKTAFSYVMLSGALLELLVIHHFHTSLFHVVATLGGVGLLLFLIGVFQAWPARQPTGVYSYECA